MVKKSLSQQIADTIYYMIVNENAFAPGTQLPNENDLSQQLGVSRATLREAIRTLVSQGILEVYRGKGTFVANDVKVLSDFEIDGFDSKRVRLRDLYETRLMFEPPVAALACQRADDQEIENILQLGLEVEETIRAGRDRTEADQAFHQSIVMAAHNEFLLRLVPVINRAIAESIILNPDDQILAEDTVRDHALLMEFIRKRDAVGAQQAMSIHIRRAFLTLGLDPDEHRWV